MPRIRDERKRGIILGAAKTLFATNGFFKTSIQDIVGETGLPIGSIYTYFKGKEEIISAIVAEGWENSKKKMTGLLAAKIPAREKLRKIVEDFLPELLKDMDFINILLSEALVYTRIEEKLEFLADIMFQFVKELDGAANIPVNRQMMDTALIVYFLGVLNAARLTRSTSVGIKISDIIAFTKTSIEASLGIKL